MPSGLPIDAALPALRTALRDHSAVVLEAPPGAGKSTIVPLALLAESWAHNKRLLMLEPRRVAARAVAHRMAHLLGEPVGRTVGYRMRFETRVSAATRIEVLTEGVLTRMLQHDPALEDVAAILFDEFHERSLQADLGLALTLDARAQIAPHLKVIVMSATLDAAPVAELLSGGTGESTPLVRSDGRTFGVDLRYAGASAPLLQDGSRPAERDALERAVATLVRRAVSEEQGGILVFLPGAGEIRRVASLIADLRDAGCVLYPLYGDLSPRDQEAALRPGEPRQRKIVLATNIAETSLTIEDVRIVIDSGLARRAVFSPSTGMSTLELQRISRASADQRAGRAGRLAPGICYRAWSEPAQRSLAPFTSPEILSSDLAPLVLELASWGARSPDALRWLDPPPRAMFESAQDLLRNLGALDADGRITASGRAMAQLPAHPRIARMLLEGQLHGAAEEAVGLATLLGDAAARRSDDNADVAHRLETLRHALSGEDQREVAGLDRGTIERLRKTARDLARRLESARGHAGTSVRRGQQTSDSPPSASMLAAFAFPDRIGRHREGGTQCYTLTNGRGACFVGTQRLAREELIVALDLDDRDRDARIRLAAALSRGEVEHWLGDRMRREDSVVWDSREEAVQARRNTWLGTLLLDSQPLPQIPAEESQAAMLQGIRELGLAALDWTDAAVDLRARAEFLRTRARTDLRPADWPSFESEALLETLTDWLAPFLTGATRRAHLSRIALADALRARLTWAQQQLLDTRVPTHVAVPSGSRIRVDYLDESAPAIAVRLQECFGLQSSPLIAGIPLTFRLLSPAGRPVQITRDLASFWSRGYADVRKDLRGRYPKHSWPENPLEAQPTRRLRRPYPR